MLRLDFTYADLNLPETLSTTRRHYTARYEELGFYSSTDFVELGQTFGVNETDVRRSLFSFGQKRTTVDTLVTSSFLSDEAKALYLARFHDRLQAIDQ